MDTERIRALLCAIEEGSLTAVSQRLGYTPSGISRMMAALEEETGFPLLVRSRGGVVPTEECRQLLPVMQESLAAADRYDQLAGELAGLSRGTIRIGTSYYAYYDWIARLIADFGRAYPGITVELTEGVSAELLKMMEEHRADLCIISRREGNFDWIPLKDDQMLACLPADHPRAKAALAAGTALNAAAVHGGSVASNTAAAQGGRVASNAAAAHGVGGESDVKAAIGCATDGSEKRQAAENPAAPGSGSFPVTAFAEEDVIELHPGKDTDSAHVFARCGVTPRIRYTTSDNYAAYAMVAAGLGVVCTNAIMAQSFTEGVVYLPLDPVQPVQIGMAIPRQRELSPAARRFAQFARARVTTEEGSRPTT